MHLWYYTESDICEKFLAVYAPNDSQTFITAYDMLIEIQTD